MTKSTNWLENNTYHHSNFSDIRRLVELKKKRNLTISLCLPTLNEEKTIAKEIIIMKSELMLRYPLLDEIAVIDSGSTDQTREIAKSYGVDVYLADDILPNYEKYKGKGENLWKALHVLKGDIIVYIDADIKNIHHRFVYGLVGPLLEREEIRYVKAFYDRPISIDSKRTKPTGGGRVTELVIRPLFSLFTPQLSQIIQPLSGEYAGFRDILEQVSFPIGYGIETSMLLDIYERWGMEVMAQVDLDKRVHRNQDTLALGRMAFGIMQTFLRRIQKMGLIGLESELYNQMIQYSFLDGAYQQVGKEMIPNERPPIIEIPEYKKKFERS
jgi:glucosyl-3-phosphoglycerate synthase